ncbi:MAG TPA: VWA domain-containing protein [Pyrinomonadaceae bacterium]|nr:VWA domain-containing protein [Pyrinomonadaceae bacterium]
MSLRQIISIGIILSTLATPLAFAEQQPQEPSDEVVRITTELVQTGVVVLDKQGKFVDGLRPDQFVLKVDGQPVTPTFFEQVVAGTAREEQLEKSVAQKGSAPGPSDDTRRATRGRSIIFFIDDLHLSAGGMDRTRKAILEFVDREMTLEDQVAVASPTGQIGFLQRFSDLKPVVRAAVSRLTYRPYTVRDQEQVPMTEYQAMRIEQGDSSAVDYFATKMLEANNMRVPGGVGPPPTAPGSGARRTTGLSPESARRLVQDRATMLMRQSESVTGGTLSTLESLMRLMSQAPGRKVVFFISDGFFVNDRSTGYADRISRIADAAVRGGMVIYSLDARGLTGMSDATSNLADPEGKIARSNVGELAASQGGMNALAVDTGGKAFFNATLATAVSDALRETSNYYLLAWRPATDAQKSPNFKRVEISIPSRPELTVRVAKGFFGNKPKTEEKETDTTVAANTAAPADNSGAKRVETALMSALSAPAARIGIPTKLSVSFVDVPGSGPVLTAATQIPTDVLGYSAEGNHAAAVDLAGVVLNDQGKPAGSFKTRLNVAQVSSAGTKDPSVTYNHKVPLKPGLYQVRVAVRDDKTGHVGSAAQWIEIPDLNSKKLALATLLLGGQFVGAGNQDAPDKGQAQQMQFSIDRRFSRESQMTFLTIIYNARPGAAGPKLDSQIEILRAGRRVIASPVRPVPIEPNTDLARIPYGAGISLKTLTPGRYVLRVTVSDREANETRVNETLFEVE